MKRRTEELKEKKKQWRKFRSVLDVLERRYAGYFVIGDNCNDVNVKFEVKTQKIYVS